MRVSENEGRARRSSSFPANKEDFRLWVNKIRAEFDCDTQPCRIKGIEFLFLLIATYGKEIVDAGIGTFSKSPGRISNLFSYAPFNDDVTWVFGIKILFGIFVMMYLQYKYHKTYASNLLWILFLYGSVYSSLDSFAARELILKDFLAMIKIIMLCGFIFYFFAVDSVHLDSLKKVVYRNLHLDPLTGRVTLTPESKIDRHKLSKLFSIAFLTMFCSMIVTSLGQKIVEAINTAPTGTPSNQASLEKQAKQGTSQLLGLVVLVVFAAPLIEEFIFRRTLMKIVDFKWWSILASGFIFGVIHLHGDSYKHIIPYVMPGFVFATVMCVSKNIWHTICAHSLYNFISILHMVYVK